MKFSRLVFPVIFLSFALLPGFSCTGVKSGKDSENSKKKNSQVIEGFLVKPTVLDNSIIVSGSLKSFEETVLMPDVSGRVIALNLPEGQFVRKGTVLVKLFDVDLQANLKKLRTQLSIAEQTQKRQEELRKVEGISQFEYDQTQLQVSSIRDDIEVLKAQISKTEVLAPFDGLIGLRNISIGAQVTPNTPLATIRETNILKLDFSVPEKYSSEITAGKTVNFSVQGDDSAYTAKIIASEGGIEMTTRNLRVRAVVESHSPAIRPGTFARVEVPLGIKPGALMIPTQSVIPQERDKKVIVAREGKATFVTIRTGVRQSSLIEVTEGLSVGDTIAVTGLLFLKPNNPIKFSKVR